MFTTLIRNSHGHGGLKNGITRQLIKLTNGDTKTIFEIKRALKPPPKNLFKEELLPNTKSSKKKK